MLYQSSVAVSIVSLDALHKQWYLYLGIHGRETDVRFQISLQEHLIIKCRLSTQKSVARLEHYGHKSLVMGQLTEAFGICSNTTTSAAHACLLLLLLLLPVQLLVWLRLPPCYWLTLATHLPRASYLSPAPNPLSLLEDEDNLTAFNENLPKPQHRSNPFRGVSP